MVHLAPPARLAGLLATVLAGAGLAACTGTSAQDAGPSTRVEVESSADSCTLSSTEVPAGSVTFVVTNSGDDITELYLYEEDGTGIVAELENIGPGLSRELAVSLDAGEYVAACKPGMVGDGIRSALSVTADR